MHVCTRPRETTALVEASPRRLCSTALLLTVACAASPRLCWRVCGVLSQGEPVWVKGNGEYEPEETLLPDVRGGLAHQRHQRGTRAKARSASNQARNQAATPVHSPTRARPHVLRVQYAWRKCHVVGSCACVQCCRTRACCARLSRRVAHHGVAPAVCVLQPRYNGSTHLLDLVRGCTARTAVRAAKNAILSGCKPDQCTKASCMSLRARCARCHDNWLGADTTAPLQRAWTRRV